MSWNLLVNKIKLQFFLSKRKGLFLLKRLVKRKDKENRVSDKYKCIYIHIPKCAGTSMDSVFFDEFCNFFDEENKIWAQHATAQQVRDIYTSKEKWNGYFKFTFVRNPFDRVASSYDWLCHNKKIPSNEKTFRDYVFKEGVFKDFLNPHDTENEENRYHQAMPTLDYVLVDGENPFDFIGRFENLEQDWDYVCKKIGVNIKLPHFRKHKRRHYREYYNKETRDKVEEDYKKDLEMFDYKF